MSQQGVRQFGRALMIGYGLLFFAATLYLQFGFSFQTTQLFGELAKSLPFATDLAATQSGLQYAAAFALVITILLLVLPITRLIGAWLGVFIVLAMLMGMMVLPKGQLAFTAWFDHSTLLPGTVVAGLGCLFLVITHRPKMTQAPARVAADFAMFEDDSVGLTSQLDQTPIDDYTGLDDEVVLDSLPVQEVDEAFNQLLFNVTREIRDPIGGHHQEVLDQAEKLIDSLPEQPKYFPRRPLIIPKLIRAVNSEESTKKDLVEVISQDPVLAGELLRVANSPYYRLSDVSIDTIGRAVIVLGVDGLRYLASTLVMQPVVQADKSVFPDFPKKIWLQSVKAAVAAQAYARKTRSCDSFTAHLLGLLSSIGHIVIFQMLLDVYKTHPGVLAKIEVLRWLRNKHADNVSAAVVESWGLSDEFVETLNLFQQQGVMNDLPPLGRALYYGRLCASLHMLYEAGKYPLERVNFIVQNQGLHPEVFDAMWQVLDGDEASLSEVWG